MGECLQSELSSRTGCRGAERQLFCLGGGAERGPRPGELPRDLPHPCGTGERSASRPGSASRPERPLASESRPAPSLCIGDGGTIPGLKN
ncbi:hypothetical protein NDU88_002587 [Pleurodeles waltl]|uniref:Uncharacterized protein n=1 Tax=Pleurodeles waltl TaxID=8319 RepID=A0AAV7LCR2_PLEWA|nr:hypothetical protein NDU88_002587 [Pleurodeles waltl]